MPDKNLAVYLESKSKMVVLTYICQYALKPKIKNKVINLKNYKHINILFLKNQIQNNRSTYICSAKPKKKKSSIIFMIISSVQ